MQALTVKEAEAKTCPIMKSSCQGDRCMFWNWIAREFSRKTELWSKSRNVKVNSAFRDDAEWRPAEGEPKDPPPAMGHCSVIKSRKWNL